jgi:hypothetical protein
VKGKNFHSQLQHPLLKLVLKPFPMKRLLPATLAAMVLLAGSGCHYFPHFKRKPKVPKQDRAISASLEKEFAQRWIDKRTAELVASGQAPDAAKVQAANEFRQKFNFTKAALQP